MTLQKRPIASYGLGCEPTLVWQSQGKRVVILTDQVWKKYVEDQKPQVPDDNLKLV